jgi:hypothetical protein
MIRISGGLVLHGAQFSKGCAANARLLFRFGKPILKAVDCR